MSKLMDVLAIIPARSGSKGIPDKNIKMLAGHPLLAWSIAAAKLSRRVSRVIVSTDSMKYADVAGQYGERPPFLRPGHISGDKSSDLEYVLHALDWLKDNEGWSPEFIILLRPTTPLRNPQDLDAAIEALLKRPDCTSLCTGYEIPESPVKNFRLDPDGIFSGFMGNQYLYLRRQDCPKAYAWDGVADIFRVDFIRKNADLYGERRLAHICTPTDEIDTMEQFEFVEFKVNRHGSPFCINFNFWLKDRRSQNMTKSNGRLVFWNGEFVPESEARVSIYDSALMFGDMVFEMTRSFAGEQFRLREHIERLMAGIKILQIPLDMDADEIERACLDTIEVNKSSFREDDEHRLMIDVSRGLLGLYEGVVDVPSGPNLIIADFPLRWTVASMGPLFDTGINAVVTSQRAIPAELLDPKIKNRSRMHYLMANMQAAQIPGNNNWALLLDTDGFVAEGTGDNFFIVKDGEIITPEGRNVLRGISRQYVLDTVAPQLNVPVKEANFDLYDVYMADEAFMTGTPFCALPVTSLNGIPIGTGCPGELTRKIINTWSGNVGVDIEKQIKSWHGEAGSGAPTPYNFKPTK